MKSSSVQGNSKLVLFGLQHFGHVAANHPADVHAQLLFVLGIHFGLLPSTALKRDSRDRDSDSRKPPFVLGAQRYSTKTLARGQN